MTEELSIIVPVYNNRKYLKKCIDSIVKQVYRNIEIILVDDGSTDGSAEICNEYRKTDARIRVIHQENTGCMQARWRGLQNSTGEYIGFVDSDDWIDSYMYQELMSVAKNKECDIVSMGYTTVSEESRIEIDDATLFGYYERGVNLDIFFSNMIHDSKEGKRGAQPSLCTKVIKRKLLLRVFERKKENFTMGEDAAIFYPCCLEMKNIYIMKAYKYFYRIHSESMCRNMTINTFGDLCSFYQYMKKYFLKYDDQYCFLEQLKNYIWILLEQGLQQVFQIQVRKVYIFPYTTVEKNSDIILYGAGEVGKSYYWQIMNNHYCNIVAWVDKHNSDGKKIVQPGQIVNLCSMKILIAIKKKAIVDEIERELISIGIDKERVLWVNPQEIPLV